MNLTFREAEIRASFSPAFKTVVALGKILVAAYLLTLAVQTPELGIGVSSSSTGHLAVGARHGVVVTDKLKGAACTTQAVTKKGSGAVGARRTSERLTKFVIYAGELQHFRTPPRRQSRIVVGARVLRYYNQFKLCAAPSCMMRQLKKYPRSIDGSWTWHGRSVEQIRYHQPECANFGGACKRLHARRLPFHHPPVLPDQTGTRAPSRDKSAQCESLLWTQLRHIRAPCSPGP